MARHCRPPQRGRLVATLALAAAALAPVQVARADEGPPPPAPTPRCARLGVIGDSLTVQVKGPLAEALRTRGITEFRIDARVSRRIPASVPAPYSGVKALRDLRAAGYQMDCFVVALGTNDVGMTSRGSTYQRWIRQLLTEIGDHPVLWVGLTRPAFAERVATFHEALTALTAEFPNLLIADWQAAMADHVDWYLEDRVHLTRAGGQFRGEWMATQVFDQLFGAPPAPTMADCSVTRTLRRKMESDEVLCLERRLVQVGYVLRSEPDVRFDTATARAVADLQRAAGLRASGIVTAKTAALLGLRPDPGASVPAG